MPTQLPTPSSSKVDPSQPLIVLGDWTVLLEVDNPLYGEARDALAPFAELEKSPEHVHTYRITNISLWNAAAAGLTADRMIEVLRRYSKFPLPGNLAADLVERVSRYGRLRLEKDGDDLKLVCPDIALLTELSRQPKVLKFLGPRLNQQSFRVEAKYRGVLKQALMSCGYPAEDLAGYVSGENFPINLRSRTRAGLPFQVREYQREAVETFHAGGDVRGGSGVIVLPCGAGKTIVGLAAMARLQRTTLILTTGITAVKQWKRELLDKTDLHEEDIKEYTGESKDIGPVTLATYQVLTWHADKNDDFPHFHIFNKRDWGLIIYDEVHLLPAPVFRVTAEIQARRRLGLTATLVREDGKEGDVFVLIGPKKYDVPWRELEQQGWIAEATCHEVRVSLSNDQRMPYAVADHRLKFRMASENPEKIKVVAALLKQHADARVLIIGQYLSQLRELAARFKVPLIVGATPTEERERLYQEFRRGVTRHLVLSKVGNFAVDLPDANVLIQVSGTFGSRQEEAQRLGRILRPKANGEPAHFYTLVTRDTREQDFAHHRQMFLAEQGYRYDIIDAAEIIASSGASPLLGESA
jgi:DNA excision repair protein ERCC-3